MSRRSSLPIGNFALPTSASLAKSTPKSPQAQGSTRQRQRPTRHSWPDSPSTPVEIRPADSKKPCYLARLPPELRLQIFDLLLPSVQYIRSRSQLWSSLLHICRVLRAEAAYIFYTQSRFECYVYSLDFSEVKRWITMLSTSHRALLSRNQYFRLVIHIGVNNYSSWAVCEKLGNVHEMRKGKHRRHFLNFSHLAYWWLWCADTRGINNVRWQYALDQDSRFAKVEAGNIQYWLNNTLLTVALPCVQQVWTRERREAKMKAGAMSMVEGLDMWFQNLAKKMPSRRDAAWNVTIKDWNQKIQLLKKFIGKW